MTTIALRFTLRRGTAANLATVNEVPLHGELVVETDTGRAKLGDGATSYNSLPYWTAGAVDAEAARDVIAAALAPADGVRITVNDAGDTITIGIASGYALPLTGSGSPTGAVSAPVGALYLRTDGGAGTTLYVKESGTGSAGWVAK